ncbi:MAG: tetratricopeptide repeat protein [Cytophagales bacterium]|nr:tetratricopeptide repeat protein [Cytophagales bacterium]
MFFKLLACLFFLFCLTSSLKASDEFQQLYDSANKLGSVPLAKRSLEVAQGLKDDELMGKAYFLIAFYQQYKRAYYESLKNYFLAEEHYRRAKNIERQISTLINVGGIFTKGGFYEEAGQFYNLGIELTQQNGDTTNELILRYQLARSLQLMGSYQEARKLYSDLIPQFQNQHDEMMVSKCYLSIGYIVAISGEVYDTADYYYSKAVESFSEEGKDKNQAEITKKYSLGYVYIKQNSFKKAKPLILSALEQAQTGSYSSKTMADIYFNLATTYEHLNMTDSAIIMYEKGIEYIDTEAFDFDYTQSIKRLYDYCRTFNPVESEACSKVIYDFTDEVVEFKDKLVDANAHYQVAAANLHRKNELLNAQQQRDRRVINFMIFLALGLVIFSGLLFYLYERKRRIQKWRKVLKELTIKPGLTNPS